MFANTFSVYRNAWQVTKKRFFPLYFIVLLAFVMLCGTIFLSKSYGPSSPIINTTSQVISQLLSYLFGLFFTHQMASYLIGNSPTLANSLVITIRRFLSYLVSTIILYLPLIMGGILVLIVTSAKVASFFINSLNFGETPIKILIAISFLFALIFVIWTIYLMVRLMIIGPIVAMEQLSIINGLKRAKLLTQGKWWWMTLTFDTALLAAVLLQILLSAILFLALHLIFHLSLKITVAFLIAFSVLYVPFMCLFVAALAPAIWHNLTMRHKTITQVPSTQTL